MLIWIRLVSFVALWGIFLKQSRKLPTAFSWDGLSQLPNVVTAYVILDAVFRKWLWRLPYLQGWLIPYPDLEGTWTGTLQTTWIDPKTKKAPGPIPMKLVITQSFDSTRCVMHTKESSSFSTSAAFHRDEGDGVITLSYIYTNRPEITIRNRSSIHDGAARLSVISKRKKELRGEYWTSRGTTGNIQLKYKSSERDESFS